MTRTFVVGGEPPEESRRQERLVAEVLRRVYAAVRPGVTGRALHDITCDVFEAEGYRTQRTGPGDEPMEGFQFSLGHGVGLQVHEAPWLLDGAASSGIAVAGDVLAVEPAAVGPPSRGCKCGLEDLLLAHRGRGFGAVGRTFRTR